VDPRAGLDDVEKRKFLTIPGLELGPLGRPARSQSPYRLLGYQTRTMIKCDTYRVLIEKLLERDQLDDLGIRDRVILKRISEVCGMGSSDINMVL
jgi:hypothetical protein